MTQRAVSRKALVLTRGVEYHDGKYVLAPATIARADAMARYWRANRRHFAASDAKIVVIGGYGALARNEAAPPKQYREAALAADILMQHGVPARLICTEIESGSTTESFEYALRDGYYAGEEFSAENPLLLVASKDHGVRRGVPLARIAFGIADGEHCGVQLLSAEREPLKEQFAEYVGGLATIHATRAVRPTAFDADDMHKVGVRFQELVKGDQKAAFLLQAPFLAMAYAGSPLQHVDLIG